MTAGIGLGLEPPLSPPVVRGYSASVPMLSSPEPEAETLPEISPVEETPAEPVQLPEIQPIPHVAPAAPVEEPAAERPTLAPLEPAAEIAAIGSFAPQAVEGQAEVEVEAQVAPQQIIAPEPIVAPEPELRLPDDPFEAVHSAPEAVATPEIDELFAPKRSGHFSVVVRLKEGDGVEVGEFRDFGTAMEGAQEVIEQFSSVTEGQWPFYAGRFIRPDLIVSVDVVDGEQAE